MSNNIISSTPLCTKKDDVLGSWLGMMPVTFAAIYVGKTFKSLSEITQGWDEVSTFQWIFLSLGFGICVTMLVSITRIAKASPINSNFVSEMLPLVSGKDSTFVIVRIDSSEEDLQRKLTDTV